MPTRLVLLGLILLRVVVCVTGVVLVYAAVFLYEDEQGRMQNKLEVWWIRLNDRSHHAISRHTKFLRNIASVTSLGFDKLFGESLFSVKFVNVSASFSMASFVFFAGIFNALKVGGM